MTIESGVRDEASTSAGPHAGRNPVRYWNDVLLEVIRQAGGAPGPLGRTAAMMHGAIFDVVNNQVQADRRLESPTYLSYLGRLPATRGANVTDAINIAARNVLLGAHPAQSAYIDGAFERCYRSGSSMVDSALGRAAAEAMLRLRANDGSAADPTYTPDGVPGAWRPTSPGQSPVTPHWGRVTPFTFASGSAFRPALPLNATGYADLLASREYAEQVNEVKEYGEADSTVRSGDQTHAALFWANDLDGTYKPPGHLLHITDEITKPKDLLDDARLFALVSFAMADALITAWNCKYDTGIDLWRPESAIRLAGTDGNSRTVPQPNWQPLSADRQGTNFSPPFPAYTSGHATLGGSWAEAMRLYFRRDRMRFTATSEDPNLPAGQNTREFTSFSEAGEENAISRLYLGVHYRIDAEGGVSSGRAVARHVFRNAFYRLDED